MFKEFIKELNGNRVEGELVRAIFYSLIVSFSILAILYYLKFRFIQDFMPKYGFFLFFAALSYSLIVASARQIRAYSEMQCMSGMMVGMTIGMIAGFLPGFFVASTNGMFVGSVFGMLIGIYLGTHTGKSCGIMGVMEGMMAGFMGGLMGAMTSFMLFSDHLKSATIIVFLISASILIGLKYMVYLEMRNDERKKHEDYFWILTMTLILMALTAWLMVFGPRGGIFA